MTEVDYHAWTAVRAIGETITRTQSNDVEEVQKYLLGEKFGLGAYKGVKVSFRSWNCLLYTSPSPRDVEESRMPSSA